MFETRIWRGGRQRAEYGLKLIQEILPMPS